MIGMKGGSRPVWLPVVFGVLAVLWLAGCEKKPKGQAGQPDHAGRRLNGVIAFVGAGQRDPLWPILKASAQRYDREMCTHEVQYLCPRGDSPQDQIDLLKSLTDITLRGVCVQLENAPALEPTLRELYNRGVLIVSMIKPAPEEIRVGHVGFNEEAVGEALATAVAEAIDDQGTLVLLDAGTKDPVYGRRLGGFEREIKRHGQIEVQAEIDCRMDAFEARKEIRERSARFPRLSAWVALDDWPLRGVGLTDQPLPTGSRLITFGGLPAQWPLIRDGTCPAVVAANYRELGMQALQACEVGAKRNSRFKAVYEAPLRIVRRSNLDAYINDWSSWLQIEEPGG